MRFKCAILTCFNNNNKTSTPSSRKGFLFHPFPKDADLRNKWCRRTGQHRNWLPDASSYVCGRHFRNCDYVEPRSGNRYLKPGAIPCEHVDYSGLSPERDVIYSPQPPPSQRSNSLIAPVHLSPALPSPVPLSRSSLSPTPSSNNSENPAPDYPDVEYPAPRAPAPSLLRSQSETSSTSSEAYMECPNEQSRASSSASTADLRASPSSDPKNTVFPIWDANSASTASTVEIRGSPVPSNEQLRASSSASTAELRASPSSDTENTVFPVWDANSASTVSSVEIQGSPVSYNEQLGASSSASTAELRSSPSSNTENKVSPFWDANSTASTVDIRGSLVPSTSNMGKFCIPSTSKIRVSPEKSNVYPMPIVEIRESPVPSTSDIGQFVVPSTLKIRVSPEKFNVSPMPVVESTTRDHQNEGSVPSTSKITATPEQSNVSPMAVVESTTRDHPNDGSVPSTSKITATLELSNVSPMPVVESTTRNDLNEESDMNDNSIGWDYSRPDLDYSPPLMQISRALRKRKVCHKAKLVHEEVVRDVKKCKLQLQEYILSDVEKASAIIEIQTKWITILELKLKQNNETFEQIRSILQNVEQSFC